MDVATLWSIPASMKASAKGLVMKFEQLLDQSLLVSCPPPGAVNVRKGKAVCGSGGRWIPCAVAIADGLFVASVYEVGPGRKQVCAPTGPTSNVDEALGIAMKFAATAAA